MPSLIKLQFVIPMRVRQTSTPVSVSSLKKKLISGETGTTKKSGETEKREIVSGFGVASLVSIFHRKSFVSDSSETFSSVLEFSRLFDETTNYMSASRSTFLLNIWE